MVSDSIFHPAHYTIYPVQPIEITRHLGFCQGNVVKYVLRAPYKGGVEDCDKALRYLEWVHNERFQFIAIDNYKNFERQISKLAIFLLNSPSDALWNDLEVSTLSFLDNLNSYLLCADISNHQGMMEDVRELSRILRDIIGHIYEGMSGLPQKEAE